MGAIVVRELVRASVEVGVRDASAAMFEGDRVGRGTSVARDQSLDALDGWYRGARRVERHRVRAPADALAQWARDGLSDAVSPAPACAAFPCPVRATKRLWEESGEIAI